ncbi:MAG TPA: hypothetical protein VFP15_05100 [Gemmatimonadaceae bacterium]|nr:hypothetical protein [Gemmatimonadaceae bacterium]
MAAKRQVARRQVAKRRTAKRAAKRRVAKPRAERKHAVRGMMRVHEFTKAGTSLNLEISAAGEKIGELEIGRGGLYWWGGHRQKRKRLSWTRFAELMDSLAYGK